MAIAAMLPAVVAIIFFSVSMPLTSLKLRRIRSRRSVRSTEKLPPSPGSEAIASSIMLVETMNASKQLNLSRK